MKIAQASSSENYTKYGVAPNQRRTAGKLDGELNVAPWYGGWERVYRPLDGQIAERIADFMFAAVANANIGYSQDLTRFGVFDALKVIGSTDPADIRQPVNCDCCTLLGAAVWYAGIHQEGLRDLCTWEVDDVFMKTGAFQVLASRELCQDGKGIRRGDCLWKTGHVAVALDTDKSEPRVSLSDQGLVFTDQAGNVTGNYPADAAGLLRVNGIRTVQMSGNAWYAYSTAGQADYELAKDATYLVTFAQRNAKKGDNAVWLVSTHDYSSISPLLEAKYTVAVVDGLTLKIVRGVRYGRVTITRLS